MKLNTRRKVLMGVLALALPVGTMAALTTSAFAKSVQNPVSCTGFGGTVTFGSPLSVAGVATSSKLGANTVITGGHFTCSGGTAPNTGGAGSAGTITDNGGKNPKLPKSDPRYNKSAGIKYLAGSWSGFAAAGASLKKTLKSISFTINGQSVLFKTKSASEVLFGACNSDVGFQINGQVKSGGYADKTASILACLGSDFGPGASGNFGSDYNHANGVNGANLDPVPSKATL